MLIAIAIESENVGRGVARVRGVVAKRRALRQTVERTARIAWRALV